MDRKHYQPQEKGTHPAEAKLRLAITDLLPELEDDLELAVGGVDFRNRVITELNKQVDFSVAHYRTLTDPISLAQINNAVVHCLNGCKLRDDPEQTVPYAIRQEIGMYVVGEFLGVPREETKAKIDKLKIPADQ